MVVAAGARWPSACVLDDEPCRALSLTDPPEEIGMGGATRCGVMGEEPRWDVAGGGD